MVLAATGGVRGLRATGPALNWVVFGAYMVGSVGALLGVALVILGAYAAPRGTSPLGAIQ
jgi:hypothetical protein